MSPEEQYPPVCDYEDSDYQTSFWDQGERVYEDRVEEIALRRLLPPGGTCMLELGAGAGRNTPRYQAYQNVVLLDYSLTQLQQAKQRLEENPGYIYVAGNAYGLPFRNGSFDGATMIRTLHHMADAPAALQEARRVLAPGAIFILEYANKLNLKAILRYWFRRQDWSPFSPEPVEFVRLNFDFHPASIRRWLAQTGLVVERQLTVSHFRIGLLKRFVPVEVLVRLDAAAQLTGDLWQLTPSVFVRSRVPGAQENTPIDEAVSNEAWPNNLFRCPTCQDNRLLEAGAYLVCQQCGARWAVRAGIYDFRAPVGME